MNNDKTIFRWVAGVSVFVLAAVIVLNRKILPVPETIPDWVYRLPTLNAMINGTCSLLLLFSLYSIRQKKVSLHKKLNLSAFFLSSLFLVSYILYHWMAKETAYPAEGSLRPVYLIILISHIILAAAVLPLILLSFYYGLKMETQKHRKLVRWAYPVWLYVTISGVVVYLMISPYYVN